MTTDQWLDIIVIVVDSIGGCMLVASIVGCAYTMATKPTDD